MPKEKEKAVALSVFARQVGCTNKTVERYIAAGKIHGPAVTQSDGGKNKVYASLALPQYQAAQTMVAHRFARSINSGTEYGAARAKTPKAPAGPKLTPVQEGELDELLALGKMDPASRAERLDKHIDGSEPLAEGPLLDLLLREHKKDKKRPKAGSFAVESGPRRPQPQGGNLKTGKDRKDADITGTENMSEGELLELDITQLTKREAVLRVMRAQIDIGKTSGELIAITKVEAALFSFGVEIRKRFEAMPARIIDSILNSKNRAAAIMAFNKEVNSCLDSLSETGNVLETIKNNRGK